MIVKYFPFQPHCFAFGGFDMQMINALEAVRKQGIDASRMDIWSRDNCFDILHLWGVDERNYQLIDWARKSNKKIVATLLLPYFGTFRSKIGTIYRKTCSTKFKRQRFYYQQLDQLVVVNEIQALVLENHFGVHASKISIIPNIVENIFFEVPKTDFKKKYNLDDYILCTGNICSRKNQLNLALACSKINKPLVLIGKTLDGETEYGARLKKIIDSNENMVWIEELPKASDELASAYYCCSVFALPSLDETQPISALEARCMNKKMVLLDRSYAHQSFYSDALLASTPSPDAIAEALKKSFLVDQPNSAQLEICKEESVGLLYKECYNNLFK